MEATDRQSLPRRRPWALIALLALFIAPAMGAWILYAYFPDVVRGMGTTNYGTWVPEARTIALPALDRRDGSALAGDWFKDHWTYVYIDQGVCDEACKLNLYKMRQVRLLQGEERDRVGRLFVVTDPTGLEQLDGFLAKYGDMPVVTGPRPAIEDLVRQFRISEASARDQQRIYLVDPLGRLVMYYEADADPSRMSEDLETFLKTQPVAPADE